MTPVNRIQENLLAKSERRLLNWLCARLPDWVQPDMLTAIGFIGSCISATGYVLSNGNAHWLWMAISGYFINWFGDSLDGSLARFRMTERPNYGYFIDHSADALANMILVCGIGFSPYVDLNIAMFGLIGYLLMSIHTFLAARVMGEFRLSYMAGGPTELRIALILLTLGMLWVGPGVILFREYTTFDLVLALAAVILVALYIVQTITTAKILLNPPRP